MSQDVTLSRADLLVHIEHTMKAGMDDVIAWSKTIPDGDRNGAYAKGVKDATDQWLDRVIIPIGTILNEEARAVALMIRLEKLLPPGD